MSITIESVLGVVGAHYGVSADDIRGHRRTGAVLLPRRVAIHLAHILSGEDTKAVGSAIGDRDPTIVLVSSRCVLRKAADDPGFTCELGEMEAQIRAT